MIQEIRLTKGERHILEAAARNRGFGWSLCTGRRMRRSDAERLEAKGLLRHLDPAPVVDGDGFTIQPERYRDSFEMTDDGLREHEKLMREGERDMLARFVSDMTREHLEDDSYVGDLKVRAEKIGEPWENIIELGRALRVGL